MTGNTFTCGLCHGSFANSRSDEETEAEAQSLWSPAELAVTDRICDECFEFFQEAVPGLRAQIDQEAAAAGLTYEEFCLREAAQQ